MGIYKKLGDIEEKVESFQASRRKKSFKRVKHKQEIEAERLELAKEKTQLRKMKTEVYTESRKYKPKTTYKQSAINFMANLGAEATKIATLPQKSKVTKTRVQPIKKKKKRAKKATKTATKRKAPKKEPYSLFNIDLGI